MPPYFSPKKYYCLYCYDLNFSDTARGGPMSPSEAFNLCFSCFRLLNPFFDMSIERKLAIKPYSKPSSSFSIELDLLPIKNKFRRGYFFFPFINTNPGK